MSIKPQRFLDVVRPHLESGNADSLAEAILEYWHPKQLCSLLSHRDANVRRIAAVTLGFVGDRSCVGCLSRCLHDEDEQVNEMAEHSLWAIWFRSCEPAAVKSFQEGMAFVVAETYEPAIDCFRDALRIDPDFAEAHNQCGIARFLLGHWRDAIEDCKRTLLRQPCHFGAMAGMGHAYAQLEDWPNALDCYRRAIAINPRMPAIVGAVECLDRKLNGKPAPAKAKMVAAPRPRA